MDIEIQLGSILKLLSDYLWPFLRVGAFVMVMPVVGASFVPMKVRLLLSVALTGVIAPLLSIPSTMPEILSVAGLVMVIQEIAIGVLLGFLVQLVFDAIALGGQVIAMSMGIGFAVFLDKTRGVNVPILGQMFLMLGMLIFLAMNGHLALIQLLAGSFSAWPLSAGNLNVEIIGQVLEWTSYLFVVAMKIALPAITAILVVNLAFGVMSRAAPTLNLFAVGFPVSMLLGFAVIFLNMDVFLQSTESFLGLAISALSELLER